MTNELKQEFYTQINTNKAFLAEIPWRTNADSVIWKWITDNFVPKQSLKSQQEQVLREFVEWLDRKENRSFEDTTRFVQLDAFIKELEGK